MKKIILGLVAASLAATPALAAAPQRGHDAPYQQMVVKQRPNGAIVVRQQNPPTPARYRTWQRGQHFDSRYARNYRQVDYRHYRALKAPPRGYRYVQSGNDAVLVGITSGLVAAVFANILR
ncbi:RcnB family protein [Sphingomonas sp. MMS12-HWE2-04]|uniref:RcnB family protein n=1 Tax=Sphingomonas sp. MMS12-HWE2-04 TaxID=3234199 RepID=UPI00385055D1